MGVDGKAVEPAVVKVKSPFMGRSGQYKRIKIDDRADVSKE